MQFFASSSIYVTFTPSCPPNACFSGSLQINNKGAWPDAASPDQIHCGFRDASRHPQPGCQVALPMAITTFQCISSASSCTLAGNAPSGIRNALKVLDFIS